MGGPGVQRSIRFVQHLNEFGFTPVVLTISENDAKLAGYQMDDSLNTMIPADTTIERVPSSIPIRLINVLNRLKIYRMFWFFLYPFFWERMALWPFKTFKKAKQLILEQDIKIIYTSSGPFSSMVLGRLLKRRLGVKWVADMRDPFTDAYAWSFPSKFHWLLARRFETKILSETDRLIVNTPEVKKLYSSRRILNPDKITVITNGF